MWSMKSDQNSDFRMQNAEFRSRKIFVIVFLVIFFDQLAKHLVRKQIITKFAIIENPGLPFGINLPGFLDLAGVLVLLGIFVIWYSKVLANPETRPLGFGLILGGALSNILERLGRGFVTDFLNLGITTVNLADLAIMMGIGILISQIRRSH